MKNNRTCALFLCLSLLIVGLISATTVEAAPAKRCRVKKLTKAQVLRFCPIGESASINSIMPLLPGPFPFTLENIRTRLNASLWSFEGSIWNGYIDFQTSDRISSGRYYTHWGYGTYTVLVDGTITMKNSYDGYSHILKVNFTDGTYEGTRNDGVTFKGRFLSKYADW